jgi:hypothetical protein
MIKTRNRLEKYVGIEGRSDTYKVLGNFSTRHQSMQKQNLKNFCFPSCHQTLYLMYMLVIFTSELPFSHYIGKADGDS